MLARVPASSRAPSPRDIMTNPFDSTQTTTAAGAIPAAPVEPVVPVPPPAPSLAGPAPARRGYSKWAIAILAPVLAVVVFASGVAVGDSGLVNGAGSGTANGPAASGDTSAADLALIGEAWKAIEDNYVDAKNLNDPRPRVRRDPRASPTAVGDEGHTRFLTADEVKATDQSLSGTFVGIGVQLDSDTTKGATIQSVIPGTPAEAAGLKRGDKITAVDGQPTTGQTTDEVVSRVRGPEGEAVTLTIVRDGGAPFDVTIVRKKFDLPLVSWAMVPGQDVAMIRLDQFSTGATKDIAGRHHEGEGGGRQEDRPRPARQPRRLRERGDRRREPVRRRRHRVPERRPQRRREGRPRPAGRPRDQDPAGRPRGRQHGELGRDRHRRDPGRRTAARWSARRRSAPAPCSAASTSPTGRP